MDIRILVKLTSRAWSLKILALMQQGVPGRQAPLLAAAGANRTGFAQSLQHLVDLGLLERNPGHGHPLRPEFRLTEKGTALAVTAQTIDALVPDTEGSDLLRRVWTVPVLGVTTTPMYFSDIKRKLPSVTDRALSHSLMRLQEQSWMQREVNVEMHPPRPLYQAVDTGWQIGKAVGLSV
ncbi:winged helix-turn-helix transcriptional regulator [Pseudoruegeria sp. HB172150]|uniref:winged helix-turn-helix transcriptional regulator n=1 Tax=Pseudoruegeria sp. HB172150 TaxID=2721164 RepID=UPI001551D97B|nr:winged helix-turn-helix transcriptional regulator [Pseudoruegeria sp. HB172150]